MSAHTSGPWFDFGSAIGVFAEDGSMVEVIPFSRPPENEADVSLARAAPDMLEALEAVLERDGGVSYGSESEFGFRVCCDVLSYAPHADGCYIVKARAAIAKAKGET